jgi:hypothetical protein
MLIKQDEKRWFQIDAEDKSGNSIQEKKKKEISFHSFWKITFFL